MTISTNQFKNGTHIEIDGKICKIIEFQHVKPGKGGAFVRTKLRRIEDGSVIDKTFRAGEKFRPVRTESKKMQYLYDSGDAAVFMDSSDYDQIEIPQGVARRAMKWVLPTTRSTCSSSTSGRADVQVPSAIELKVAQTDPGSRATPPPAAATSPRRWRPGSSSRCRSSSRRANASGSTPAAASTSPAPERSAPPRGQNGRYAQIRPAARRRVRQLPARRHRAPAGGPAGRGAAA